MWPQSPADWLLRDRANRVPHVSARPRICVTNGLAQRELVLAGAGPAILPAWLAADDLAAGRLFDVLPDYDATPGDFDGVAWLLYSNRTWLPAKTRALVDFLKRRARPEWSMARPKIRRNSSARG
ncbi:LysR substrate-binding domain-containing protein [Paraburkholderia sp. A1RI-2L]